ncbi:hypothetical protein BB559_000807 [Furculomyces boomerangus]|uniref:Transcription factor CBF/NF-Y/archaeal histone domain-containing protein n=2 Tax=Harpellales TaxID=61421 RepID=A0A2T9Z408_9FUNG|nr:hypothetical protein BB559_000807 [Furculomyces boomerangus]PVZ98673.1 hypothetical protein BB558_005313 [Smittium angustum]
MSGNSKSGRGVSVFPISRVKRIIKEDKNITALTTEATFLVSKAVEMFVREITANSYKICNHDKRKTIKYKDMSETVQNIDKYYFLEDIIPSTVSASGTKKPK